MLTGQTLLYFIYVLAAAAVILAAEALYVSYAGGRARAVLINRRLKRLAEEGPAEQALQSLLRERGLTNSGDYAFGVVWLNRLYTQSGITGNPLTFAATFILAGLIVALLLSVLARVAAFPTLLSFLIVGFVLPLLYLRRARNKRIMKFAKQLPDALDMIVRSLRAGHPISVAVGLVAREMPDPLGTEFGIVSDEITFGLSMEQAARKLSERVGFEGLQLLSVSLSIQSRTGGNLTEILANLSKVLRERQKLKLKIRALSAEGRFSAWVISLFPIVMFLILAIVAPSYYGKVWGNPLIFPVFTIFGCWGLLGDFIMYRMINFDY
ncbi:MULTISPECIES: type II secretion system F family protein [unclassified Mesorhizobium]|uniref:type II secretion system F family protein n=1 Tax=unclassified Mesorhizobium TaxID=325217 RepID=UPI000BAF44AC|nr:MULTISPECIES: type II secretion system F family protein [unclassified Mesorhizobium]PBB85179.1 type II secretion system protein F [Mesorhizobium sp. WSM3876]RWB66621.1 MAG: type II secretion system F family protein [Mesorhizobium sp.]RWB83330.1 MAG: type II secretion system F family protein [Mesorhizobium sp.]TGS64960.1 type II secretion system F family protein [Mesorhizobium sp. M3A.F.Ca.ET.201.01.1.1]TGS82779.1 type II secretion system F family protein [Mesorhizobium sp. M3A.F.Ca.ET.175.0